MCNHKFGKACTRTDIKSTLCDKIIQCEDHRWRRLCCMECANTLFCEAVCETVENMSRLSGGTYGMNKDRIKRLILDHALQIEYAEGEALVVVMKFVREISSIIDQKWNEQVPESPLPGQTSLFTNTNDTPSN